MPVVENSSKTNPEKDVRTYELRQWDPTTMCKSAIVILQGKKASGKSTALRNLMWIKHPYIQNVTVFSETSELNSWFEDHMPLEYVHNHVNLEQIKKYIEFYKQTFKGMSELEQIEMRKSGKMDHLYIFDDVTASAASWRSHPAIGALATQSRWLCTDVWVAAQNIIAGVPPSLREAADYTLIFRHSKPHERKQLFDHYSGGIPNLSVFNQLMDQLTEDYECMVINNNATSNKLEDIVHYWKAKPTPPFRMGTKMDKYVSRLRHIDHPAAHQTLSPYQTQKRNFDDMQTMIEHFNEAKKTKKIKLVGKGLGGITAI